jgi:hypothetical protein
MLTPLFPLLPDGSIDWEVWGRARYSRPSVAELAKEMDKSYESHYKLLKEDRVKLNKEDMSAPSKGLAGRECVMILWATNSRT